MYDYPVLIYFTGDNTWNDFRAAELTALLRKNGVDPALVFDRKDLRIISTGLGGAEAKRACFYMPYVKAFLPSAAIAKLLCGRSVLIRAIYHLWVCTEGNEEDTLTAALAALDRAFYAREAAADVEYALSIEAIGHSFKKSLQNKWRDALLIVLGMQGKVNLSAPTVHLSALKVKIRPDVPDDEEYHCFFGRIIATSEMKAHMARYDLGKREYVGPTSLDNQLSLLMANVTCVDSQSFVMDPFVGTASILVAASHYGGRCYGADIDLRVMKGDMYAGQHRRDIDGMEDLGHKRDVFANFASYGLARPELIRMDNHLLDRHCSSSANGFFDAVITDPPYSIRAAARKSGRKGGEVRPITCRDDHMAVTQSYKVEEVMLDLLHSSARLLSVGGMLAYLLPAPHCFDPEVDLPIHPCFQLEEVCCQLLSVRHNRCLVVVRKTREYTPDLEQEYISYKNALLEMAEKPSALTIGFAGLMFRLVAALEKDYSKNDEVVVVASKRTYRRKGSQAQRAEWREEGKVFPNDKWQGRKEEQALERAAKTMSLSDEEETKPL
jgi:tRNA (guanine10-N2)-methyltransferase